MDKVLELETAFLTLALALLFALPVVAQTKAPNAQFQPKSDADCLELGEDKVLVLHQGKCVPIEERQAANEKIKQRFESEQSDDYWFEVHGHGNTKFRGRDLWGISAEEFHRTVGPTFGLPDTASSLCPDGILHNSGLQTTHPDGSVTYTTFGFCRGPRLVIVY